MPVFLSELNRYVTFLKVDIGNQIRPGWLIMAASLPPASVAMTPPKLHIPKDALLRPETSMKVCEFTGGSHSAAAEIIDYFYPRVFMGGWAECDYCFWLVASRIHSKVIVQQVGHVVADEACLRSCIEVDNALIEQSVLFHNPELMFSYAGYHDATTARPLLTTYLEKEIGGLRDHFEDTGSITPRPLCI
jgi:hypothetical protein